MQSVDIWMVSILQGLSCTLCTPFVHILFFYVYLYVYGGWKYLCDQVMFYEMVVTARVV